MELDSESVRKFLLGENRHRATRKEVIQYLGHKPHWDDLFGSGVIREVDGCPNHVELVE